MPHYFSSIRSRVLLLLSLVFCSVLVVAGLRLMERRNADLQKAQEQVQLHAQLITQKQMATVQLTREFVSWLIRSGSLPAIIRDPACPKLLGEYASQAPHFANIFIADVNGNVVCSAVPASGAFNISDRIYFQKSLAAPGQVIGAPMVGAISRKWALPFSQRFTDAAGRVRGVVIVSLDLEWVNSEFAKVNLSDGGRMGLVDSAGTVLARYPDPEGLVGQSLPNSPFFKAVVAHHGAGTADTAGHDGVERIFAFSHFAEAIGGPIYLWVGYSKAAVTGSADLQITQAIFFTFMLALFSFFAVWYVGERLVVRPIGVIAEAARRLSAGDHRVRSGLAHRKDEIGELARAFDQMAVGLLSKSELFRLNRALQIVSDSNRALAQTRDETQLLGEICRTIVETGGYRLAWIGYAEDDAEKRVRPVARYGHDEGYLDSVNISWADTERGRGPSGTAIRTGKTQANQSFETGANLGPWREEARKRGYRSVSAFPLAYNSRPFGVLTIYSEVAEPFSAEEVRLLEELARDISYGIHTKRVREEHQRSLVRLESSMEAAIKAMVTTLEMRDPYTAGHERRVCQLAVAIARELGLPEDEIHGINLAAAVHDMGNIQIPAEILVKPSSLNQLEFRMIQSHPQAGYDILKNIDFPWPVADYVRQHHERLDSSGYPHGLKGDQMLRGSKIVAVADVVEAMVSHRPYRPAYSIERSLGEILAHRGTRYDPAAVDACVRLFRDKGFALEAP